MWLLFDVLAEVGETTGTGNAGHDERLPQPLPTRAGAFLLREGGSVFGFVRTVVVWIRPLGSVPRRQPGSFTGSSRCVEIR